VLRDHDTLRICPALMADAGVPAPDYAIDRSTPNTLILDAPDALLAYLQTLGIGEPVRNGGGHCRRVWRRREHRLAHRA
jgi:hypothetical protein